MWRAERTTLRHLIDAILAAGLLALVSPLLLIAAAGIALSSRGPIIYRAQRIARDRRRPATAEQTSGLPERRAPGYRGREFTMYKFRTMDVDSARRGHPITSRDDERVFRFGAFLRATKIDELPQLVNVIKGDMALVGPRPEAPEIVRRHYQSHDLETLQVPPGLTSPGSLYYYTRGESVLEGSDVMQAYVKQLLPVKLEIDREYLQRATFVRDAEVLLRTIGVLVGRAIGRRQTGESDQTPDGRNARGLGLASGRDASRPPKVRSSVRPEDGRI